jgi:hypothetical protein
MTKANQVHAVGPDVPQALTKPPALGLVSGTAILIFGLTRIFLIRINQVWQHPHDLGYPLRLTRLRL